MEVPQTRVRGDPPDEGPESRTLPPEAYWAQKGLDRRVLEDDFSKLSREVFQPKLLLDDLCGW